MRVAQGCTQIYCPHCKAVQVCEAIATTQLGKPSGQRWYRKGHEDLQWFRRGRRCQKCQKRFVTAEVDEGFLEELVELRKALAHIKLNAEDYMIQASAAAEALARLNKSLSVLRALKVYQEAGKLLEKPISALPLSVRARLCLEAAKIRSVGELCERTPEELLELRNFGMTTLQEIRAHLSEIGLKLKGD